MKKLLLCLSALFLSVSFATAQETYEISTSTGTLTNGNITTKSGAWTSTELDGFTLESTCNGGAIDMMNVNSGLLQLYANYNNNDITYTLNAPEGYSIKEYTIKYKKGSSSYGITITAENGTTQTPTKTTAEQTFEVKGLSGTSTLFTLKGTTSLKDFIKITSFIVTFDKGGEGGEAPVEYTVSATASPAEGGTATVNGVAEATTTGGVELEAVPAYGYKFVRWTLDGNEVTTTAQYTTAVDSDVQFVAVFEKLTNTNDWYAAIAKPSFGKAGNTTFVKAATLAGDVDAEVAGIKAEAGQQCVTKAIEVAAGAEFDLNITYQLNWGDLAIYQIDNDGATKEYGYYLGSWESNGNTEKVVQYLAADERISVSEVVDGACTVTYPITINENHNPGDVIVVRAITGKKIDETNSAYEQNIVEGGYVDFLFVVTEEVAPKSYTLAVGESEYATLFLDFNATIPENVDAYIVTEVNKDYVTLIEVTGVLPANTGIIVNASADNYDFVASTETLANVTGNLLEGSVSDEYIQGEAYVLGIPEGETEVALCKAKLNLDATGNNAGEKGTHFLNNANRAYLPVASNAAMSASLRFDFGGTTGVEKVEIRNEKEEIYDLTGRRVNEITKAGVYVVNGKKVLVK